MADGIQHSDITNDEDLGRMILIRARRIAPQITTVADGTDEKADAVAVLRLVAKRAVEAGTGAIASQSRNGTSITRRDIGSAFRSEDLDALRTIFDIPAVVSAGPVGSFPPAGVITGLWPERPLPPLLPPAPGSTVTDNGDGTLTINGAVDNGDGTITVGG